MQEGRRRFPVSPLVIDTALACLMATVTIVHARHGHATRYQAEGWPPFGFVAVALSVAANLPLAVRRLVPGTAFAVSCGALVTYTLAGYQPSANVYAPLLALCTVITSRPLREALWASAATAAVWVASGLTDGLPMELALAQAPIGVGAVWLCVAESRRPARDDARPARPAGRSHDERDLLAQQAVMRERLRIARELHDAAAHHLSEVTVQAGLAETVFASDPVVARAAVTAVGTSSRRALQEMRGLLDVLRTGTEPADEDDALYRSAPGLSDLEDLMRRTRAAGVEVDWSVSGHRKPLPAGLDVGVYRMVEEVMAGIPRCAGRGSRVTVSLAFGADVLRGDIVARGSTARGVVRPSGEPGLLGIRERVRLYGGSLRVGSRAEGGFEVVFTVPLASQDTDGGA
ncbi:sensor histidine kinase [Streptomyces roseoviridis]|uniref:histidine kinase n=1 Tax=Streptomyces roseoviridis TaxID=67361 RepID=A0ABV5QXQ7_9ACTN